MRKLAAGFLTTRCVLSSYRRNAGDGGPPGIVLCRIYYTRLPQSGGGHGEGNVKVLWVGMALGAFGLGAARFLWVPPPEATHFHANWAIYVDGERLDLSDRRYMKRFRVVIRSMAG